MKESTMIVPETFSVIYQSNNRTPSVFDLHDRGMFKTRPFVTCDWGFRVLVDDQLDAKLEFVELVEKEATDPESGEKFGVVLQSVLIDLSKDFRPTPKALAKHVPDKEIRGQLKTSYEQWRDAYVPANEKGDVDREALKKKLASAIAEYRNALRKKLVRKNGAWVESRLAYQVQQFRRYLYPMVSDNLHGEYQKLGGADDERGLVRKVALLQCIYDSEPNDPLRKPDGAAWDNEDEVWECWNGLAGSDEEAKRIGRALLAEFKLLIEEHKQMAAA
jgi:hypothetical protein